MCKHLRIKRRKKGHHFRDTEIKLFWKHALIWGKSWICMSQVKGFFIKTEVERQISPKFDFAKVETKEEKRKMEIKTWVDHKRRSSERWEEALLKLLFPRALLKAVSIELWISLRGLCWTQNPGQPGRETSPDLQPLSHGFVTWSTKCLSSQPSLAVSVQPASSLFYLLLCSRKGKGSPLLMPYGSKSVQQVFT